VEETQQNWQSSRLDDPNLVSVKNFGKVFCAITLTAKETFEGIRTIEGIYLVLYITFR